ncbi:MAG: ABC transporter substrate-binding protein [Desulfosarcina sp.]|nr:ABC transporter substrate-binding protein [Desulfobacterales bacterium]
MKLKRLTFIVTFFIFFGTLSISHAVTYIQSPPFNKVIKTAVGTVKSGEYTQIPLITWGGDIPTIYANGNSATTTTNSIFAQKGLKLKLVREDVFKNQIEAYLRGDTPYLRGTLGMINMAEDLLSQDARTKPVIIYQMTWSNGGDCLVVKPGIKTAKDLKGKTIALQAYGPHVDYLAKILKDAGLSMENVNILWTKDLTGSDNSPAEALYDKKVDAVLVIIPDGLMLTSNGTVGTGSEGSVKGAKILLSTKTANHIIADVYAVRSDYFTAHKTEVETFVHGLLIATQKTRELFKNRTAKINEYKKTLSAAAKILLDSPQATGDAEALFGDCNFAGLRGNIKFFYNTNWPRNLKNLTDDIHSAFIPLGIMAQKGAAVHAMWNYDNFKQGLTGVDNVESPRFKTKELARVVAKKQAMGTLDEGELFRLEINFKPNQKVFPEDIYAAGFKKIVELASTYGGAVIAIERHSDPHKYNKLVKKQANPMVLKRTKQAAKNLSMSRALEVRKSIIKFARAKDIPLDESQFTVIGHGISNPKYPNPQTKEEWLSNMRVMFRIIQIEAEESVFEPLN